MRNVKFDKLVRDKIPEIVQNEGNSLIFVQPKSTEELNDYIRKKILEEATEVVEAKTKDEALAELGDLLAIMLKYGEVWKIKPYEVLITMAEKSQKAGGFEKHIILKEITYKK